MGAQTREEGERYNWGWEIRQDKHREKDNFTLLFFFVLSVSVICLQLWVADASALTAVMSVIVKKKKNGSGAESASAGLFALSWTRNDTFWLRLHCSAHSSSTTLLVILAICSRKVTHRRRHFCSSTSICKKQAHSQRMGSYHLQYKSFTRQKKSCIIIKAIMICKGVLHNAWDSYSKSWVVYHLITTSHKDNLTGCQNTLYVIHDHQCKRYVIQW